MHNIKSITQKDRYGNMFSLEMFEDQGVPMIMMIPDMANGFNGADTSNHPGNPKGTDTVPAWLTPGENVVNAEASRLPGNQEKIDEMNEQGRAIQQAQGGPIPTYAAGGMEVPRYDGMLNSLGQRLGDRDGGPMYAAEGADADELLRRFLELEEGKRNTAYLDSAGVPTIGFGSTRGVRMGDKIDDAHARQKLMADMRVAEEDYNKLVTADLNPNQQTAVKSLLFNIGGPQFANSKARAALNAGDFDAFQKEASEFRMADGQVLPGLEARRAREMSLFNKPIAQAVAEQQTSDKPSIIPPVVGMLGDQKVYSNDMGEFVMTPEGEVYLDDNQLKAAGIEVMPVPPVDLNEAPPKPYKEISIGQIDPYTGEEIVTDSKDLSGTAIPQSEDEYEQLKVAVDESTKVPEIETPPTPEYDSEATGEDLSPADQAAAEAAKIKAAEAAKLKAAEAAAAAAKDAAAVTQPPGDVTGAGTDLLTKDPTFAEEIKQGFIDMFGEMFSPKEIARMNVNYAGSRALGYDHGASLKYSSQTYVKTLAAQRAQLQKDVRDKDFIEAYTKESLDKYLITGNRDDLIEKSDGPSYNQTSGNAFIKGIGVVQKFKDSKSGVEAVEYNGQLIPVTDPRIIKLIEPWNEGVYGVAATKKGFLDFAKGHGSYLNNEAGLKSGTKNDTSYDERVDFPEEKIAEQANVRFREIIKQNGSSIRDLPDLIDNVNSAIERYMEDTIAYKQKRRKTKPLTVRAYINDASIETLTGVPQSQIGATSTNNTNELNKRIEDSMRITDPKDPRYAQDYVNQWQATYQAYRLLPTDVKNKFVADAAKQIADNPKDETKHYSGFTLWASKTSDSEVAKIITELKAAGKL